MPAKHCMEYMKTHICTHFLFEVQTRTVPNMIDSCCKKTKKKGNQRLLFLRKFLIFIIYNLPLSLKTEASVVNLSRCAPRLLVSPLVTFSIWNKCYGPFWTLSILWVANATSKVKVCSLSKLSFREWIHILTYSICYFLNKFLTFPSWDCRIPVSLGH